MTILGLALLLLLWAAPAMAQVTGYWLYVDGTWKANHWSQEACAAAGVASGRPYECRMVQRGPGAQGSSKWEEDVQYCRGLTGADAYVSAPGQAKTMGTSAERFEFSKCMTERGNQLAR